MRRVFVTLFAGLVGLGIASVPALAGGGCHNRNPVNDQGSGSAVEIRGCAFHPVTLFVSPGTTVTWKNSDVRPHNVVGVGWGRADDFEPARTTRQTFSTVGVYPYQCSFHPGMAGAIVVGSAASADGTEMNAGDDARPPTQEANLPSVATFALLLVGAAGGMFVGRRLSR